MITEQIVKQVAVVQAVTPTAGAAGATDIEGTTIDMQGFEGVLGIVTFGAITGSAVTGIVWQGSDASDMSNPVTYADGDFTVADDDDGQVFVTDLYRPRHRYVRLHIDRATQNAVVASAECIKYGAKTLPTSFASATVNVAVAVSPAAA